MTEKNSMGNTAGPFLSKIFIPLYRSKFSEIVSLAFKDFRGYLSIISYRNDFCSSPSMVPHLTPLAI